MGVALRSEGFVERADRRARAGGLGGVVGGVFLKGVRLANAPGCGVGFRGGCWGARQPRGARGRYRADIGFRGYLRDER